MANLEEKIPLNGKFGEIPLDGKCGGKEMWRKLIPLDGKCGEIPPLDGQFDFKNVFMRRHSQF